MLFVNPVFQPVNFAIRNAWIAGGIEFNVGVRGHGVFTTSKVFCTINQYNSGIKTVKVYEYERIRDVVYSIEFYLPDDSDTLFARIKIENNSDCEKYMYWWTNIAIKEEDGLRVLAPAKNYFRTDYEDDKSYLIYKSLFEKEKDVDPTRPTANARSRDFFYKVPERAEKWIVSADREGYGIAYTSTKRLKGRKLFVWGVNNGGRNWRKFLSENDSYYAEIQGGLSYHQFEHIPMPKKTVWEWTEAFTPFQGNAKLLHSDDICIAQKEAERSLKMNGKKIKRLNLYKNINAKNFIGSEYVTVGSGWGYIENIIRLKNNKKNISTECNFERDSVGDIESEWLHLIEKGYFPHEDASQPPKSFMSGKYILQLLLNAVRQGKAGAYTYLQLGTVYFTAGNYVDAKNAWEKSAEIEPNAWALRNIAFLKRFNGDNDDACRYILKAVSLNNSYRALVIDCADILVKNEKYREWMDIYKKLSPDLQQTGRVKLYAAKAFIELDMLDEAKKLINKDLIVEDLQEGELTIEKLWDELYTRLGITPIPPLPKELDFRMNIKSTDC